MDFMAQPPPYTPKYEEQLPIQYVTTSLSHCQQGGPGGPGQPGTSAGGPTGAQPPIPPYSDPDSPSLGGLITPATVLQVLQPNGPSGPPAADNLTSTAWVDPQGVAPPTPTPDEQGNKSPETSHPAVPESQLATQSEPAARQPSEAGPTDLAASSSQAKPQSHIPTHRRSSSYGAGNVYGHSSAQTGSSKSFSKSVENLTGFGHLSLLTDTSQEQPTAGTPVCSNDSVDLDSDRTNSRVSVTNQGRRGQRTRRANSESDATPRISLEVSGSMFV